MKGEGRIPLTGQGVHQTPTREGGLGSTTKEWIELPWYVPGHRRHCLGPVDSVRSKRTGATIRRHTSGSPYSRHVTVTTNVHRKNEDVRWCFGKRIFMLIIEKGRMKWQFWVLTPYPEDLVFNRSPRCEKRNLKPSTDPCRRHTETVL